MKIACSLALALASFFIGATLGYVTREPEIPDELPKTVTKSQSTHPRNATTAEQPKQAVPARPSIADPGRFAARLKAATGIKNELPRCREIIRTIETIPIGILPDVLNKLIFQGKTITYNYTSRLLMSRFAETDPHGAIAWLTNKVDASYRAPFANTIFTTWSPHDPVAARASLESIADPETKGAASAALDDISRRETFEKALDETSAALGNAMRPTDVVPFASINPVEAARRIAQFPAGDDRLEAVGKLATIWLKQSPTVAFRWAADLEVYSERELAMEEILPDLSIKTLLPEDQLADWITRFRVSSAISRWASKDPEAAARWLAEQPVSRDREQVAGSIAREWAKRDPRAAIDYLQQQFSPGDARDEILKHLAGQWAYRDPGAAIDWATKLPNSPLSQESLVQIIAAWAFRNPEEAADYVRRFPASPLKDDIIQPVVETWAKIDPKGAIELANQVSDPKLREDALDRALYWWSRTEPFAAGEYLYRIPTSERKQDHIWSFCGALAGEDIQKAVRWAAGFPDPKDRATALFHTMDEWAEADPEAAGEYALSTLDKVTCNRIAARVVEPWLRCDPAAAARWAARLPEGEGRESCFRNIMENWAHVDEPAAVQWLEGLPQGPSRDAAVSVYVHRLAEREPEGAFRWSLRIKNVNVRQGLMWDAASRWLKADPKKAEIAIRSSGLTEQEKEMLLMMAKERPAEAF